MRISLKAAFLFAFLPVSSVQGSTLDVDSSGGGTVSVEQEKRTLLRSQGSHRDLKQSFAKQFELEANAVIREFLKEGRLAFPEDIIEVAAVELGYDVDEAHTLIEVRCKV